MRPLAVALLSWEYPPVVVGGLSRHVFELARGLAGDGHGVTVYARGRPGAPEEEWDGGVRVVRVLHGPPPATVEDLVPWVVAFNEALHGRARADLRRWPPEVLHAHDWLVARAGVSLKRQTALPLVATIHATEHGRHGGRLAGPIERRIHGVERWLVAEAARVITCSDYMQEEVSRVLGVVPGKVDMIPNEVDPAVFGPGTPVAEVRRSLSLDGRPLILFAGRLEFEKGVQTVLQALPTIDRAVPGASLVVAGTGTYRPRLEAMAAGLGLDGWVRFEGFVGERRLRDLYGAANVVVVPSLYEPFGLVALETMACGTPVVAADAGGLREIVRDGVSGLRFAPGDAGALARQVARVLTDAGLARRLAAGATAALARRRTWAGVSARTVESYRRALLADRGGDAVSVG